MQDKSPKLRQGRRDRAAAKAPRAVEPAAEVQLAAFPPAAGTPPPPFQAPDAPVHSVRLGARLRNYFLTGLVVVGPVTITLYISWYVIQSFDNWVKPYIPRIYNPDNYLPFALPGAGLLFAIIGLTMIGALAANLLGRSLISAGELMLDRMPIVRNVYKALKQIFESVVPTPGGENPFQKVAVMEFPSPGIYAIVFITGAAASEIAKVAPGDDLIAVFMPTHLMPPSGFTVFVPRTKVTVLEMSTEDAAKIILSAGMVTPDSQARLKQLAEAAKRPKERAARIVSEAAG